MSWTVNTNIINDTNQYLLDAKNVKGTFVVVASTSERDALPAATTINGSLCYCTADSKFYQYNGSSWQEKEFGGTNNTAGATNNQSKLFLIGAESQDANPQTYSQTDIYMTSGTLTANNLSTNTLVSQRSSSQLNLKVSDSSDALHDVASFGYSNPGGAHIDVQGHLMLNEAGGHVNKPENKTGLPSVNYADYFNTGITTYGISASSGLPVVYTLSFPGISGTLSTIKYKHNIVLSGDVNGGNGGHAHCTFSFINDSPDAISSWERLCSALSVKFKDKVCPACGLFGYDVARVGVNLWLITGISFKSNNLCFYGKQLASTNSSDVMTITSGSSADEKYWGNQISSSATITDTVEEC